MKRLLLASAALALSGCAWDYSSRAPQIPVAPTISAKPVAQALERHKIQGAVVAPAR